MDKTISSILVTGSSGTIGTRLCEKLLEKGFEVIGLDQKRNQWNQEVNKITRIADLRDAKAFKGVPKAGMIIHLAANARVYNSVLDPSLAMDNMKTTFNALEHARKSGIKKLIFASSREVYGNTENPMHREEEARVEMAESPYSATKLAAEALVRAYGNCYGMDFIITRFSNVYGMYDNSDRLVPNYIRRASKGEELHVYGRDKTLDFTYIDDSVNGIMAAIERFDSAKNDVYNIAAGKGSTILEVAELIKSLMKSSSNVVVSGNRPGEVVKYVADISKARQRLGYDPKVGLEEGLRLSIEWFRERKLI